MKAFSSHRWILFPLILALVGIACLGGGLPDETPTPTPLSASTDTPDDGPPTEAASPTPLGTETLTPTPTRTPTPTPTSLPAASVQETCESLPREAVSTFLYGLAIGTVVSEQQADGVYCRFETVDVDGTAGDLGRSAAVAVLKLWDTFEACQAAGSDLAQAVEDPPSPWTYLHLVPIPNDPARILSVTAFDGDACLTVAAADVSSQPLDFWLAFMGALAAGR